MRRRKYKTINPHEGTWARAIACIHVQKKGKKKRKKKKEKTKEKKKKGKNGGLETRGGLEGAVWRMKNPRASCGNVDITVDGEFPFTDSGCVSWRDGTALASNSNESFVHGYMEQPVGAIKADSQRWLWGCWFRH